MADSWAEKCEREGRCWCCGRIAEQLVTITTRLGSERLVGTGCARKYRRKR